jgi:choline trimethylamine-lyase
MHGRNKKGITATMNSVSKLDFNRNAGGPLQLEIDPSLLKVYDPAALIEGLVVPYFKMGGVHVFININSSETLEKAMKNPEQYEHLIIRVTGFSVHFVQLDRKIQEEIIKRTRYRNK